MNYSIQVDGREYAATDHCDHAGELYGVACYKHPRSLVRLINTIARVVESETDGRPIQARWSETGTTRR